MDKTFESLLVSGAEKLGYPLDETALAKMREFYQSVVEYNKKVNLTAILDEKHFVIKHLLDSITAAKFLPDGAAVCDLGAGAGFPSIPLKILRSDLRMTMLDALNKRVTFLNLMIERLGLTDTVAYHMRAEEAGRGKLRESFDFVAARAVAGANILLEYAMPLLCVGGQFICYKGRDLAELVTLDNAKRKLSAKLTHTETLTLPHSEDCRNLLIFTKTAKTNSLYPRTFAQISKNPL